MVDVMPRPRPHWRAPYKINHPGKGTAWPAFVAKRTAFNDFSPESNRRQCAAIKRNGDRCGNNAVQGVSVCRMHRGTAGAFEKLRSVRPETKRSVSGTAGRKALAALALVQAPEGLDVSTLPAGQGPVDGRGPGQGLVALGRAYEAFLNRELDPKSWRLQCQRKT